MTLLVARELSVRRNKSDVIRKLDLEINSGEIVAVLGSNGAGKSTLIAALAGLVPLSGGSVERRGRVVVCLQQVALARRSVLANLELALAWWGVPRGERKARSLEALRVVHAEHLAERAAGGLSGGEQRRVHLARAIAVQADLLLLDEPFSALDTQTRDSLVSELASVLHHAARSTVIVVHDRDEAWALATRLIVMIDGRIAADGAPADLLANPPSPQVALFLGFTGRVESTAGSVLMVRPANVRVCSNGEYLGRVTGRIGTTDGVRLDIALANGQVQAFANHPGPEVGSPVRVDVAGGVEFPVTPGHSAARA